MSLFVRSKVLVVAVTVLASPIEPANSPEAVVNEVAPVYIAHNASSIQRACAGDCVVSKVGRA